MLQDQHYYLPGAVGTASEAQLLHQPLQDRLAVVLTFPIHLAVVEVAAVLGCQESAGPCLNTNKYIIDIIYGNNIKLVLFILFYSTPLMGY
jgi:hypothetical protein